MSSLLYTPLTPTTHTWLELPNRAFKIDEGTHAGKVIVVRVEKTEEDVNLDGLPDQLNAKFTAWLADEATGEKIQINGTDVITNSEVHSLLLNMENDQDSVAQVANFMGTHIDDFVHKALRKEMTLQAWHSF